MIALLMFIGFAIGLTLGAAIVSEKRNQEALMFRPGLSRFDVEWILDKLSTWAEKYREANPTGRYRKRREVDLFWAADTLGIKALKKP